MQLVMHGVIQDGRVAERAKAPVYDDPDYMIWVHQAPWSRYCVFR